MHVHFTRLQHVEESSNDALITNYHAEEFTCFDNISGNEKDSPICNTVDVTVSP